MTHLTAIALVLSLGQAPQAPAQKTPPAPPGPSRNGAPAAQPAPAPALPVLTIADALKIASERNLDLKVLRAQLDAADEISWKAWSGYLPRVTGSGSWQAQREITATLDLGPLLDAGGVIHPNPIPTIPLPVQTKEVLTASVDASQTLFSPTLWYQIRSAQKTERATKLNLGNARRSLLFGVASAYYAAASLKQAVAVSERLLETAQRQENDSRVRYQAGTIAKVGLLRAEIDRARAEQDLKRSRNSFESARVALATLLDRGPDFDVVEPPAPPLETTNADDLVATALRARLDVQAAREEVSAAREARRAVIGRYFPNVAAFGRFMWQSQPSAFAAATNWFAGLQLQWTFLDGFLRESDLRTASANIAAADAGARSAETKARQDVLQALLDLDSARANAAKAKEQRDLAAENQRLVDVSYRAGAATAVELADATAALRNAEIASLTESLNAQLAAVRVLQVAGEFDPEARR